MNFGRSLRPLYVTLVGLALAAAVGCASPTPSSQLTSTPTPMLEAIAATATHVPPPPATETQPPETPTPPLPSPTALPPPTATSAATAIPTETATPTPPTPTPLPPTPVPNPAVVYATSIGLGQDKDSELVVAGLARFGLDYKLDDAEKAFIDAVAANPLEVQLAMVNSPYMTNGKLSLVDLVAVADTLQKYHPKQREAVWAMPDKTIQFPSGGSFNPSSLLELIVKKDAKAVKVLDYMQSRIFDNPNFWEAFKEDKLVTEGIPGTRATLVRWDAKNWPVKNWQAMMSMMLKYDPFSYVGDDLDKMLDGLGVHEYVTIITSVTDAGSITEEVRGCINCYDRSWNLLEPQGSNGSIAYFNLNGSEGNIVREWLKAITHHVWADGEGLLVKPFTANNAEQLVPLYGRDPIVNTGSTTSFASRNVIFMDRTKRPDGTYASTYEWAKSIVGDTKDPREATLRIMGWYLGNVTHHKEDNVNRSSTARDYKAVYPQNPTNPAAWTIPLVKLTSSGLNITGITAALRSLGIPAEGIIEGETNAGLVVVNEQNWYYSGDSIFNVHLGITSCNIFGTYEQVNTLPARRGDGSFCN